VGKNFLLVNAALLLAGGLLVRRISIWREALADRLAVDTFGALAEAERLLHSGERFRARTLAADLRLLTGSDAELTRARTHYDAAYWLWQRNSRIPGELVMHALYNYGCLAARQKQLGWSVSLLFEAFALAGQLAKQDPLLAQRYQQLAQQALHDSDLASLGLLEQRRASQASRERLVHLGTASALNMAAALHAGTLHMEDALPLLAELLRTAARPGASL